LYVSLQKGGSGINAHYDIVQTLQLIEFTVRVGKKPDF